MTIKKFRSLSGRKQAEVLWEHGILIGERQSSRYYIMLYQVEGFYIETLYHKYNTSITIKCFETTNLLQPYLTQIDIDGLLQAN